MGKELRSFAPYDDIVIGEDFNSRKDMGDLQGLAMTLDRVGLLQALVVREGGPARTDGRRKLFLIAGERRYRAIGLLRDPNWVPSAEAPGAKAARTRSPASWAQVEVKFVKGNTQETAELNLIENLQREGLQPLEEADAMKRYMDAYGYTQAQLAARLGISEPVVSQRLALLKRTAPEVKEALAKGTINATHVREMVPLPQDRQKEVLKEVEEQQQKGKKVSTAEVKQVADRHKAEVGIKKTREPKSGGGVSYDDEKLAVAREVYAGKPFEMRPKTALIEQLGDLIQRVKRSKMGEAAKQATKAKIATIEWFLGLRDSL